MTIALRRTLLGFLLLTALGIGGWAYFAPMSWYATFPGFGLTWLPQLGPFNEHFVKDVGAMFLGLATLSVGGLALVDNTRAVRLVGATWLTFNTFHLTYHIQMLHMYGVRDRALNLIVLGLLFAASATLLLPERHRAP